MARIFGADGGGWCLFVVRTVLVVGCALLAGGLAVVLLLLLLGLANREPNAEEVIGAFRDEVLEVGEVQTVTPPRTGA